MQGKRGVVLGVANNRSIAWGIAKACRGAGGPRAGVMVFRQADSGFV